MIALVFFKAIHLPKIMGYFKVIWPALGILSPRVGGGMWGLCHARWCVAVKVSILLTAMEVVSRSLTGTMVAAWQIERIRRSSGLWRIRITMRIMHHGALILCIMWLRTIRELIIAVFKFLFVLAVATPMLHGTARSLLILELCINMRLLSLVASHRPGSPVCVVLVGDERRALMKRNTLLLLMLLLLLLRSLTRTGPF